MDLRPLLSLAPATLRPVLAYMVGWMERTDDRLRALEEQVRTANQPPQGDRPC